MEVEKFRATSGRTGGAFTLLIAGALFALGLVELDRGFPPWVVAVAALLAVLTWASALRPALHVERADLVMTNMFETVTIPLAAIEEVTAGRLLSVRASGDTYLSSVVGRKVRPVVLGGEGRRARIEATTQTVSHADYIEERLRGLADDARRVAASRPDSPEQQTLADGVRRERAWLPIVLVGAATLGVVATLAL